MLRVILLSLLVAAVSAQTKVEIISKGKPTFQSSTAHGGVSSRAVDGKVNPFWGGNTCTGTANEDQAWWAVDLGARKNIISVKLFNRADCCHTRLSNFDIGVSDTSPELKAPAAGNYRVCHTQSGPLPKGASPMIRCRAPGRYLIIQLKGKNILTLCEVLVWGFPAIPLAPVIVSKGKPTFQSSTAHGGVSSRAVDGNVNPNWSGNTCSGTAHEHQPWWAVDLGERKNIRKVRLSNRADCCNERLSNLLIGVSDTSPAEKAPKAGDYRVCKVFKDTVRPGPTSTMECSAIGRYVIVQLLGTNILTLCEVSVYAMP